MDIIKQYFRLVHQLDVINTVNIMFFLHISIISAENCPSFKFNKILTNKLLTNKILLFNELCMCEKLQQQTVERI